MLLNEYLVDTELAKLTKAGNFPYSDVAGTALGIWRDELLLVRVTKELLVACIFSVHYNALNDEHFRTDFMISLG
jgi:hypothetical protein